MGNWWICGTYGHEKWNGLYGEEYNENMRTYHVNVAAEGKTGTYNYKNTNGSRVIITDHATDVEGILKWFDFENTELGTRLVGYGLPNTDASVWHLNEDGTWYWDEEKQVQITTDTASFDWEGMRQIGGQCLAVLSAGVEPMSDGTYYWYDQSNVDKWKVIKDTLLKETLYDHAAFDIITLPVDSMLPTIKTSCEDIAFTAVANAIFAASEDEAVAIMEQCREDLIATGIEELTEYYTEQYKANIEKWSK